MIRHLVASVLVVGFSLGSAHAFTLPPECSREICGRQMTGLESTPLVSALSLGVSSIVLARDARQYDAGGFRRDVFPLIGGSWAAIRIILSAGPRLVDEPGKGTEIFKMEAEAAAYRASQRTGQLVMLGVDMAFFGTNFALTRENKHRAVIAGLAAVPLLYSAFRLATYDPIVPANAAAVEASPAIFGVDGRIAAGGVIAVRF